MPRRILEGDVVSNVNDKTVTVLVERRFMHPVYKKYVMRTDRYAAHDPQNKFKEGDRVQIIETAPISKTKRWRVIEGGEDQSGSKAADKAQKAENAKAAKPAAKKETEKKTDKKKAEKKTAAKSGGTKKETATKKSDDKKKK